MNEIEQLRARLLELQDLLHNLNRADLCPHYWSEVDSITTVLNLLDPNWFEELPLNKDFKPCLDTEII